LTRRWFDPWRFCVSCAGGTFWGLPNGEERRKVVALSCTTPRWSSSCLSFTSKIVMGVVLFTFKDHKKFVLNFLLTFRNRCVRKFRWYLGVMVIVIYRFEVDRNFCGWAVFGTTNSASIEALPFPLSVCILLCSSLPLSYACLATLRVDFFKVLIIQ
jgi:hypothetical protein